MDVVSCCARCARCARSFTWLFAQKPSPETVSNAATFMPAVLAKRDFAAKRFPVLQLKVFC